MNSDAQPTNWDAHATTPTVTRIQQLDSDTHPTNTDSGAHSSSAECHGWSPPRSAKLSSRFSLLSSTTKLANPSSICTHSPVCQQKRRVSNGYVDCDLKVGMRGIEERGG
eukprot:1974402-Rhodomonas_salina.4